MFVYDITNEDSFKVMDQMINDFKEVCKICFIDVMYADQ